MSAPHTAPGPASAALLDLSTVKQNLKSCRGAGRACSLQWMPAVDWMLGGSQRPCLPQLVGTGLRPFHSKHFESLL